MNPQRVWSIAKSEAGISISVLNLIQRKPVFAKLGNLLRLYIPLPVTEKPNVPMILFPPCKINIGLDITSRRADGYHEIDTLMYPVRELCDSLEIIDASAETEHPVFSFSGIEVDCRQKENIVVRAWELMHERYGIGAVKAHLHKAIPFGAGLGGGSADAAFMLRGLNELFSVGLDAARLARMAVELGSDVPFFIYDEPMHCTGRGEIMSPVAVPLSGCWMVIVKPHTSISTAEAYAAVTPCMPRVALRKRLCRPVPEWKGCIGNAFESTLFRRYPELSAIKESIYGAGAVYASMSGSGSALYGIFTDRPEYLPPQGVLSWTLPL